MRREGGTSDGLGGRGRVAVLFAAFFLCAALSQAWASVKQIKMYKEAFPDEKPKCMQCHVDEKPKKDDGQHELNDYGKKVVGLNAEPDASTYTAAGQAPAVEG